MRSAPVLAEQNTDKTVKSETMTCGEFYQPHQPLRR
jgi:hypothetical protein